MEHSPRIDTDRVNKAIGSMARLTISRLENPDSVVTALQERHITYFPVFSDREPETIVRVGYQHYYGEKEILDNIEDIHTVAVDIWRSESQ